MNSAERAKFGLIILFCLVGLLPTIQAQDPLFSQYYASSLYLNPSMAATEPTPSFSSNYRQQWRSIVIPYVTNQASFLLPFYAKRNGKQLHIGGGGLSFYNDRAGDGNFKTIGISLNSGYNLYLTQDESQVLTFGVQAGIIQKRVDYTNLEWGEQYNPYIGYDASINPGVGMNTGRVYPDIGAGIIYNFKGLKNLPNPLTGFIGFAATHINNPNESFYRTLIARLPVLYKAHGGINIRAGNRVTISPNVLVMMQKERKLLNGGIYLTYKMFDEKIKTLKPTDCIVGGWYRLKDSFIVSAGISNETYTIGLSYDFNVSNLRYDTQGRGAFEISLALRKVKDKKFKRYNTPRI